MPKTIKIHFSTKVFDLEVDTKGEVVSVVETSAK